MSKTGAGAALVKWREVGFGKPVTQVEVGSMVGCGNTMICMIESGECKASPELALKLQHLTGINKDTFLYL